MGFDTAGFLARIFRLSRRGHHSLLASPAVGCAAGQDRAFPGLRGGALGDYGIMVLGHANPLSHSEGRVTVPRNWWRWSSRGTGPSR